MPVQRFQIGTGRARLFYRRQLFCGALIQLCNNAQHKASVHDNERADGDVVVDRRNGVERRVDAAVRAVGQLDVPAVLGAPRGIVQADLVVKRHPVLYRLFIIICSSLLSASQYIRPLLII